MRPSSDSKTTTPRVPRLADPSRPPRVLVVDDDVQLAHSIRTVLGRSAYVVEIVSDAEACIAALDRSEFDVVLADLMMPGASGLELLEWLRARDPGLPVVMMTGSASLRTASEAIARGVFRYLAKPLEGAVLREALMEAVRTRRAAPSDVAPSTVSSRRSKELAFRSALSSLHLAYQPIVESATRRVVGYEALMRTSEPTLPHPGAVLDAAASLDAMHELGRVVRARAAEQLRRSPCAGLLFVNLHPDDLNDAELYAASAPLSELAPRVVLEITERASLDTVPDLDERIRKLRGLGFRLALDDLGEGYAGLTCLVRLQPEIAKIDMSLVRGIDRDPIRERVVLSLTMLARGLGIEIVAEGVETVAERDTLVRLGCTYLQGYGIAKPGPPFPEARWVDSAPTVNVG